MNSMALRFYILCPRGWNIGKVLPHTAYCMTYDVGYVMYLCIRCTGEPGILSVKKIRPREGPIKINSYFKYVTFFLLLIMPSFWVYLPRHHSSYHSFPLFLLPSLSPSLSLSPFWTFFVASFESPISLNLQHIFYLDSFMLCLTSKVLASCLL